MAWDALWEGLVSGRCGIGPMTRLDVARHRITHCGEVPTLPPDVWGDVEDLALRYLLAASSEALTQAGLADAGEDVALVVASNFAAMATTERLLAGKSGSVAGALHNGPIETAAARLGMNGPKTALSLSCASGNAALGHAADLLRSGMADVALAVGYDAISEIVWSGLTALRAMSAHGLLPFDARRDGTIFGEGAGALALETATHAQARGARPLARFLGYGASNNAFHMTHPDAGGEGMIRAMRDALADAGVEPDAVDHINAHGTGTPSNDKLETAAIKAVFGAHARRIPISGVKSMIGHGMGAAGALEAVAVVKTLQDGRVPPTINLLEPDPDCDLDYVPLKAREADVRIALNNSAGFGGCNASVILQRWENG